MKALLTTAALFAAALFILDAPAALAADPDPGEYRSITSGNWNSSSTWEVRAAGTSDEYKSAESYPQTGDDVIVQSGDTVTLTANATCGSLDITGEVDTGAYTLTIEDASGLTINSGGLLDVSGAGIVDLAGGGTHTINGTAANRGLRLAVSGSILRISSSATISGTGYIEGRSNTARIEMTSTNALTSSVDVVGAMEIRAGSGTFTNSDVVHANRFTGDKVLTLYDGTISGAGEWKVSAHDDAVLRFDVSATGLTGAFTVMQGTLDINEDVCTTSNLNQTGGTIDVAAGKSFKAGGSCP